MAHNNRIRLPGTWTPLSVVMPGEFEALDEAQYEALNADLGGTWAPAAQIKLGGAGLWVSGASRLDDAEVTITTGKGLVVNAGAAARFDLGSQTSLLGTATLSNTLTVQPNAGQLGNIVFQGAVGNVVKLKLRSYSFLETDGNAIVDFKSATTIVLREGALFYVEGSLLGNAPFQFGSGGWALWNNGSAAVFGASSTLNLLSGATQNVQANAVVNVQTGGQLQIAALSAPSFPGLWAKVNSLVLMEGTTKFIGTIYIADGITPTSVLVSAGTTMTVNGTGPLPSSMTFLANTAWTFGGTLAWVKAGGLKVGESGVGAGAIDLEVTDNSRILQKGHQKREGVKATTEQRIEVGPLNSDTFDPSDADIWIIPNLGSNITWTWTTPKKPSTWKVVGYQPGNTQTLAIAGIVTTSTNLNAQTYEAITFSYDGFNIYRTGWEKVT